MPTVLTRPLSARQQPWDGVLVRVNGLFYLPHEVVGLEFSLKAELVARQLRLGEQIRALLPRIIECSSLHWRSPDAD